MSNNRFGIGIAAPTANLQVAGDAVFNTNVAIGISSATTNRFYVQSGSTAFVINQNGNVGIGISNPTASLQVMGIISATTIAAGTINTASISTANVTTTSLSIVSGFVSGTLSAGNVFSPIISAGNVFTPVISTGNVITAVVSTGDVFTTSLSVSGSATITGNLSILTDVTINGNLILKGNVTTDMNSERLDITNNGTGPAFKVNQIGSEPVIVVQQNTSNVLVVNSTGELIITGNASISGTVSAANVFGSTQISSATVFAGTVSAANVFGSTQISSATVFAGNASISGTVSAGTMIASTISGLTQVSTATIFAGNASISGNVGIGTATPAANLHIFTNTVGVDTTLLVESANVAQLTLKGDRNNTFGEVGGALINMTQDGGSGFRHVISSVQLNDTIADGTVFTGTSNNSLLLGTLNATAAIHMGTNSNVAFTIGTSGNVGIGTTNPSVPLHVQGAALIVNNLSVSSIDTTSTIATSYISSANVFAGSISVTGTITATNIGIGTITPTAPLHIDLPAISSGGVTTSPQTALKLRWTEGVQNLGIGEGTKIQFSHYLADVTSTEYEGAFIASYKEDATDTDTSTSLIFGTRATGDAGTTATERVIISSGGNIGIGTTNPAAKLDITGEPGNMFVSGFSNSASTNPAVEFRRGQGTLTVPLPVGSGDVLGGIYGRGYVSTASGVSLASLNTGAIRFGAAENFTDTAQGTYIDFATTGLGSVARSVRMVIASDGNVGIGTTVPATNLHLFTNTVGVDTTLLVESANVAQLTLKGDRLNTVGEIGGALINMTQDGGSGFRHVISTVQTADTIADGNVYTGTLANSLLIGTLSTAAVHLGTNANVIMTVSGTGYVGIGTTSPTNGLLHVDNTVAQGNKTGYYFNSTTTITSGTVTTPAVSIYGLGYIWAGTGFVASSDRRIKKDIVEIDDDVALQAIRRLKPSTYKYVDTVTRTNEQVYGFIAQEVKEVLPYAVTQRQEIIPDIYKGAILSDGGMLKFSEDQLLNLNDKLRILSKTGKEGMGTVTSVIDSRTSIVEITIDGLDLSEPREVFVYGREVQDFHVLQKEAIFTVGVSAIQELDRQQQLHRTKLQELQMETSYQKMQIEELQNQNAQLKARLEAVLVHLGLSV